MSVLSARELKDRMWGERAKDEKCRLIVTPLLGGLVGSDAAASIDIRLGCHFSGTQRVHLSHYDPFPDSAEATDDAEGTDEAAIPDEQAGQYELQFSVPFGAKVVLHPQQSVLACTLEYLRLPLDLTAQIIGRSWWGRRGLVIATASVVHPGYTGVLTLELENLGEAPIRLKTGARIGQLVFQEIRGIPEGLTYEDIYRRSKYVACTRPSMAGRTDAEARELARFPKALEGAPKRIV